MQYAVHSVPCWVSMGLITAYSDQNITCFPSSMEIEEQFGKILLQSEQSDLEYCIA